MTYVRFITVAVQFSLIAIPVASAALLYIDYRNRRRDQEPPSPFASKEEREYRKEKNRYKNA